MFNSLKKALRNLIALVVVFFLFVGFFKFREFLLFRQIIHNLKAESRLAEVLVTDSRLDA